MGIVLKLFALLHRRKYATFVMNGGQTSGELPTSILTTFTILIYPHLSKLLKGLVPVFPTEVCAFLLYLRTELNCQYPLIASLCIAGEPDDSPRSVVGPDSKSRFTLSNSSCMIAAKQYSKSKGPPPVLRSLMSKGFS
jgi:hypothetical protein